MRSINGGLYETIALNITETQFTDNFILDADTVVDYSVSLGGSRVNPFYGDTSFLLSLPDSEQGIRLKGIDESSVSALTKGKIMLQGCLSFTFPGMQIIDITFSDSVFASNAIGGAICDENGTTVSIYCEDSVIFENEVPLFTLGVDTDCDKIFTVSATYNDATQNWGNMDFCTYNETDGLCSWSEIETNCITATYNSDGKLLDAKPFSKDALDIKAPADGKKSAFVIGKDNVPKCSAIVF